MLEKYLAVDLLAFLALGVGWDGKAYTFPMHDQDRKVIGIRRRFLNGRKLSVKGSKLGLFLSKRDYNRDLPILITEGESDCAAALALGFQAVGRPNNRACRDLIQEWLRKNGFKEMIVVADNDKQGRIGAKELADQLAFEGFKVKIIAPPDLYKDFREWFVNGARSEDVSKVISGSELVSPIKVQVIKGARCTRKIIIELPD